MTCTAARRQRSPRSSRRSRAIVCGTLVWRGRLIPLALATGLDVGLGIVLPRGTSGIGALLRILPQSDVATAETLVTIGAIAMFVAAMLCLVAIPSAIKLRRWARAELATADYVDGAAQDRLDAARLGHDEARPDAGAPRRFTPGARQADRDRRGRGPADRGRHRGDLGLDGRSGGGKDDLGFGSAAGRAVDASSCAAPIDAAPVIDAFQRAVARRLPRAVPRRARRRRPGGARRPARSAGVRVRRRGARGRRGPRRGRASWSRPTSAKGEVTAKFHQIGRDGDVAWIAEELRVGGKTFVVDRGHRPHASAWTIPASTFRSRCRTTEAYRLARDGDLAIPDAIPDRHDESALARGDEDGVRDRKPSFVEARSTRDDAFNFGSAPGERLARRRRDPHGVRPHPRDRAPPRCGPRRHDRHARRLGRRQRRLHRRRQATAPTSRRRSACSPCG